MRYDVPNCRLHYIRHNDARVRASYIYVRAIYICISWVAPVFSNVILNCEHIFRNKTILIELLREFLKKFAMEIFDEGGHVN